MSRRRRVRDHLELVPEISDAPHPCPGQCNREWRQAEIIADTERHRAGEHQPPDPRATPRRELTDHPHTPQPGRPYWCVTVPRYDLTGAPMSGPPDHYGCADRIEADLRAIPELAAMLTPGKLNTPRDVADLGGSGRGIDPPTNSPAWDDVEGVIRWAVALEDQVRERYGHPPATVTRTLTMPVYERGWWVPPVPRPGGPYRWLVRRVTIPQRVVMPRLLGDAVAYLAREFDRIMRDPDLAVTVGQQIMSRRRSLEQDTGTARLVHRLPGICMVCKRKGLRRADGTELVKCPSCGACWDWEHYRLLARGYGVMVRGEA